MACDQVVSILGMVVNIVGINNRINKQQRH